MSSSQKKQEMLQQLKDDLEQGESHDIELKRFSLDDLSDSKAADKMRFSLAKEMAALAKDGGRIYLGIDDKGTIIGVKGSCQDWQEQLIQKSAEDVDPSVSWKADLMTISKKQIVRINLIADNTTHYVNNMPYIREGASSKQVSGKELKDIKNMRDVRSRTQNLACNILTTLNLYQEDYKERAPFKDYTDRNLDKILTTIRDERYVVNKQLGKTLPELTNELKSISESIRRLQKIDYHLGPEPWDKRRLELTIIHTSASSILKQLKSKSTLKPGGAALDKFRGIIASITEWLQDMGAERGIRKFSDDAVSHSIKLLAIYYSLQTANQYNASENQYLKNVADELDRLSGELKTPTLDCRDLGEDIKSMVDSLKHHPLGPQA